MAEGISVGFGNGDFAWEVMKKCSLCVDVCCRVVVCGVVCSCMLLLVLLNIREIIFCNTSYAKTPFRINQVNYGGPS